MKSIKLLLAALAVSTMFASCAKEEMVKQVNPNGEFVGAKLVGTNISMDFGKDSQTKLTGTAWESTDQLGLGWVVTNAGYDAVQNEADDFSADPAIASKLYANHLFQLGDKGNFTTKGNVYEGWHFAYYPFAYEKRIGQVKNVVVNPKQTELWAKDRYNTCLYLSAREFLTESDLNADNELNDVTYEMFRAMGTIGITVNPSAMFTGSDALKNLNIESVTIKTEGVSTFVTSVKLQPAYLPEFQYKTVGTDLVYDAEATKAAVYTNLDNGSARVLQPVALSQTVTTEVENDAINLTAPQTLRVYVYPTTAPLTTENTSITIEVEGGQFNVAYVNKPEAQLSAAEKANNAAITAIVNAFKSNGALADYYADITKNILSLNLELTGDIFKADFTDIYDEEQWDKAVAVADALELEEATFTITKTPAKTPYDWAFEDLDEAGNLITLPQAELTVNGRPMIIGANGSWPAEGITATSVKVNKNVTLTVADNVTLDATVDNDGTIAVGKKAKVMTVNNEHGRINVVYGSYLVLETHKHGVIAYNVTGKDMAYQINYLTKAGNALGDARVNTLVLNNKTFNLSMVDTAVENDDPYNGIVTPGAALEGMDQMNFELNNGTLKADPNSGVKVAAVEVLGGTKNAIWNTNITNDLTITAGKVTVDAAKVGTYTESLKVEGNIDNKGELVANANIYTTTIKNPVGAKTTVNPDYVIWYTTDYEQGGSASGYIKKLESLPGVFEEVVVTEAELSTDPDATVAAKENAQMIFKKINTDPDFKDGSTIYLPAGTFDFKDNSNNHFIGKSFTLVGTEGTIIKMDQKGLKIKGADKDHIVTVNIKNVTIDAGSSFGVYVKEFATVNLQNVDIKTTGDTALLVENASDGVENTSVLNAYNVTIPATSNVYMCALPCTTVASTKVSKIYVNYEGGNITDAQCKAQGIAKSTGNNMFVNGVALPAAL